MDEWHLFQTTRFIESNLEQLASVARSCSVVVMVTNRLVPCLTDKTRLIVDVFPRRVEARIVDRGDTLGVEIITDRVDELTRVRSAPVGHRLRYASLVRDTGCHVVAIVTDYGELETYSYGIYSHVFVRLEYAMRLCFAIYVAAFISW